MAFVAYIAGLEALRLDLDATAKHVTFTLAKIATKQQEALLTVRSTDAAIREQAANTHGFLIKGTAEAIAAAEEQTTAGLMQIGVKVTEAQEKARQDVEAGGQAMRDTVDKTSKHVQDGIGKMGGRAQSSMTQFREAVEGSLSDVQNGLNDRSDALDKSFEERATKLGEKAQQTARETGAVLEEMGLGLERLVNKGTSSLDELLEKLSGSSDSMQAGMGKILESLAAGLNTMAEARASAAAFGQEAVAIIDSLDIKSLQDDFQHFMAAAQSGKLDFDELLDELTRRFGNVSEGLRDALVNAAEGGKDALDKLREAFEELARTTGKSNAGIDNVLDELIEQAGF